MREEEGPLGAIEKGREREKKMEIILRESILGWGKPTANERNISLKKRLFPTSAILHVASVWSDPAHPPLVSIHSRSYREQRGCAFFRREKRILVGSRE